MTASTKTALITGGARGIGRAAADALLADGWSVVVGDLEEAPASAGAPRLATVELDVRDEASINHAVRHAVDRFGSLDLLVNNAGIHGNGKLEDLPFADWSRVLDVNLHGVLRCLQAAGRHMLAHEGGAIVNISSIAGARGVAERVAYAAAKAAVDAITRTAAVEWAPRGIRVNAVAPGFVDTELLGQLVAAGTIDLRPVLARTPMRRLATPAEIGSVVAFLASPAASYVTGQVLYADGGFIADYGVAPGAGS